jgi:hypothetical protein
LYYLIILCCISVFSAYSGINEISILPGYLGGSNAGTEFLFSFPPVYEEVAGGNNSFRVFVVSGVRQEVTVEVKGKGIKLTKTTNPNEVVEFRISTSDGLPYFKPISSTAPPEKVYPQSAIQVKSQEPIVVYGVAKYQYTSDGFLAIPVSTFGNEYVIAAYPQYTAAGSIYDLPSVSNIIAAYDNTEVTFTMGGTKGSRTTGGLRLGQKKTVTMMRGDVWCFAAAGDAQDISGSLIQANKPIGVVSGNQCANVPSGVYACDVMNEMELPTFTWGKEYHVTPLAGRQKAPVIRVFAKEKDTKVFRDGQDWMRLTLNSRGEGDVFIERRAFDGNLNDLVNQGGTPCKVISADKPIYVMLYNPGQTDDNVVSDPFQMVLTPLEQYQKEIVFSTPNGPNDSLRFTRQFVNLVYENTPDGAIPDDLEYATVVNGKFTWKKISVQFGPAPGFKFAIPVRGKNYSMKRLQLNGDGVFRIRSSSPIAAYLYGFGSNDSYGFPAYIGMNDLEISGIDSIKPTPEWKKLCDGSVVGKNGTGKALVIDKPINPSSRTNVSLIYLNMDSSYNYSLDYTRIGGLLTGIPDSVEWSLNVVNPKLEAKAHIIFVDRAGNDTTIQVTYYPFDVAITGLNTSIQKANIGKVYTDEIYLVNKSKAPAIVNNVAFKRNGSGFSIDNTQFPLTIPARDSIKLIVNFKADKQGRFIDTLVVDNGCNSIIRGVVVGDVVLTKISTNDIDFGEIEVGKKMNLPFLMQNTGESILTINGYSLPKDTTIFKTINFPEISSQNPLVLAPGEIKLFNVEFSPLDANTYSDSINFTCDANNNDSVVKLIGKGKIISSTNETATVEEREITIVEEGRILHFVFNIKSEESMTIGLYDLLGNSLISHNIQNPFYGYTYSINVNDLVNGVYIAIIKQGNRKYVRRLMIK